MTDWFVTLPYATGLITVEEGEVVITPPIFRWMLGMRWLLCKEQIVKKGGHGEVVPPTAADRVVDVRPRLGEHMHMILRDGTCSICGERVHGAPMSEFELRRRGL